MGVRPRGLYVAASRILGVWTIFEPCARPAMLSGRVTNNKRKVDGDEEPHIFRGLRPISISLDAISRKGEMR